MNPLLTHVSQKSTRSMDGIDLRMEIANDLNTMIFPTDMSAAIPVETGNGKELNWLKFWILNYHRFLMVHRTLKDQ